MMKLEFFLVFMALVMMFMVSETVGHHLVTEIIVDGVAQGAGTCVRVAPTTNPLTDVNSNNIVCNVGGDKSVDWTCAANAGSEVTVQWRIWPDGSQDGPIDVSHQGPCSVYIKRINQGHGSLAGDGWLKIWHDGVKNGQFCTERLRANGNKMSFRIPKDFATGHYVLRFEQIALHQGGSRGGAQFYVGCAQVFIRSTGGTRVPSNGNTVRIPGFMTADHPGLLYDWWMRKAEPGYQVPGPAPYISTNTGGGRVIEAAFDSHPKYTECLVKNANWCAVSLPAWSNEQQCYNANAECWKQLDACYKSAPVTGHAGCMTWEKICGSNNVVCRACGANRNSCSGVFPNVPKPQPVKMAKREWHMSYNTWHMKRHHHWRPRRHHE